MQLWIAGGCGEHGRNCFLVQGDTMSFLVDCGLMAEEGAQGVPRLSARQIRDVRCVFLTHSHADHSGAIPWLQKQGYSGPVIASGETLAQLPFSVEPGLALETLCPGGRGQYQGIDIEWGRSGHCRGSVWFHFRLEGKQLLFSGDYTQNTQTYAVDPILGQTADLAVIDCAYGTRMPDYEEACRPLLTNVAALLRQHPLLVFPVPKFGRGTELLWLFYKNGLGTQYYADAHFLSESSRVKEPSWYKKLPGDNYPEVSLFTGKEKTGIVFLSNPQLRTEDTRNAAERIADSGGYVILTGTVENGTYAADLRMQGKAALLPYPVHLNLRQSQRLCCQNSFGKKVFYHSAEILCDPIQKF